MNNTERLEIYLRGRSEPTPAQRRRLSRHANLEQHQVVRRASRMRKSMERRDRREQRAAAQQLIAAMRQGVLRPSAQRLLRAQNTLDRLRAAVKR